MTARAAGPVITDDTPIGPDVDLDREDIRLADGTRLTNARAEDLVDEIRALTEDDIPANAADLPVSAALLRHARKGAQLTRDALAAALGATEADIERWENTGLLDPDWEEGKGQVDGVEVPDLLDDLLTPWLGPASLTTAFYIDEAVDGLRRKDAKGSAELAQDLLDWARAHMLPPAVTR